MVWEAPVLKSDEFFLRAKKVSPGGVHSPVRAFKSVGGNPIFFKSAKGANIQSVDGKSYIDFCQSFGPNILGHRDEDVASVVREMNEIAWSLGACEPYSLSLAEWIVHELPWVDKVRFVCSGTEAVMSALRVAKAATGRSRVLKFEGCYHGHADGMLVKAGSGLAGTATSDSAGVSDAVANETVVAPLDDEESFKEVMAKYGSEIAVVALEPLPANFGLLPQRRQFLDTVITESKKAGALLLFDEVISGFRIGMGGMAEALGVTPDLVTYGKIIGGGFPVGAYGGKAELMDLVAPDGGVYQAGTLAANPIGMSAGLATLQKIKTKDIHQVLLKRTSRFVDQINKGFTKAGIELQAHNEHSLFWLHKTVPVRSPRDFDPEHGEKYRKFFHACLERGVYLAPSAFEVGFVSYAHSDALLSEAAEKMVDAANSV
ncbi:MAG: aminotransferase class III-fold pyridoxal phosphate-dependent enzyme [Gammaproteobacteria bacterium]|nr:aminotransferase class III-fold pyridoxal phosphate-dependent enzyme [Gammaproteobacteria bacterium]